MVDRYNKRHQHSGLPKITGEDGRRRHMTPAEAWQAGVERIAAPPPILSAEEVGDVFWPRKTCKTHRGLILINRHRYFHPALEHESGEEVVVACNPRDASSVRVYNMEDRLLCEAGLNGNSAPAWPKSEIERAVERRGVAAEKRLQAKIDRLRSERDGPPLAADHDDAGRAPKLEERLQSISRRAGVKAKSKADDLIVTLNGGDQEDRWYTDARRLEMERDAGASLSEKESAWLRHVQCEPFYKARRLIDPTLDAPRERAHQGLAV